MPASNITRAPPSPQTLIGSGGRNCAFFDHLRSQARYCDQFDDLLDVARTFADTRLDRLSGHSFTDAEVLSTATSVWEWTETKIRAGEYHVGQQHVSAPFATITPLADKPFATHLLVQIKKMFAGETTFNIPNGLSAQLGLSRRQLQSARQGLLEVNIIRETRKASSFHGSALYEWGKVTSSGQAI